MEHEIAHQQSLLAKLKQAILQEAIQGKLTADWRAAHPEVKSASKLLLRIQAEKARLIADKKLRPEKSLPKITPAEIPFEIPKDWEWCRYGNLCEYVTSGSRGWQQYYADRGALFVRAQNIKTDKLNLDDETFVDLPDRAKVARAQIQHSDILITITGSNLAKTALIEDYLEEAFVSQHIALTRLVDTRLAKWLHQTFVTEAGPRGQLLGFSRGDKPGINLPQVRNVLIPLPPLAEQVAIVERVEALMTTARALEAEIEQARTYAADLLQAVLKEAFAPASS
jgi:type I restriction enzyme S subunit